MKKLLLAAAILGFSSFAFAQDDAPPPVPAPPSPHGNQSEEIIIHNKGDKDLNMNIQINGDSIMVNGKPLNEFIDSQVKVTIKKNKMMIRNGNQEMAFDFNDFGNQWDQWGKQWDQYGKQWEKMGREWEKKMKVKMNKAFLGVTTQKSDKGVKVLEVVPGSAAEKAGLQKDDIITKINDEEVDGPEKLSDIVADKKPNDEVTINYIRNNKKEKKVKVILGEHKGGNYNYDYSFNEPEVHEFEMPERPEVPEMPERPERPEFEEDMLHQPKLGLKIQETDDGAVKIIDVEDSSNAAKAGLEKDDIITEIDGEKIDNTDEARDRLHPEEDKKTYNIKVLRNSKEMSFDVKIPHRIKTADL